MGISEQGVPDRGIDRKASIEAALEHCGMLVIDESRHLLDVCKFVGDHVHKPVLDVGIEVVSRAKGLEADLRAGDGVPHVGTRSGKWSLVGGMIAGQAFVQHIFEANADTSADNGTTADFPDKALRPFQAPD